MQTLVSVFGVRPCRIGGTETFARELSRQLHHKGWRSVLCFLDEPTPDVREFLAAPNVEIQVVDGAPELNWHATKSLARILRRYRSDILHLHFTGFLAVYPWLAKLLSVKHVFFTDHSSRPVDYEPKRAPFWKRAASRMINRPLDNVVCVSKFGRSCLTTLDLLPQSRHALIYNAVDHSRITANKIRGEEFKRRFGIPAERTVVVQVSWMIPEKGVSQLLKTANEVVARNPKVHFVLVGEGSYRRQFMQEAEDLGIQDHVTWTGLIEDPFAAGVYDAADIVCQFSEWQELFGWMIAEAMAFGKPVVANRVGGIPELVQDGLSGFLIERGDSHAAADKIQMLAVNPMLRDKLGAEGRRRAKANLDLQTNVARLVQLYGI